MPVLSRVVYNVLCRNVADSIAFYQNLADLELIYQNDWYAVLSLPGNRGIEIGLIDQVSEFTPRHASGEHYGTFVTLVVDDVFEAVARARELGVEVIEEPMALAYGQTRALIRDPNGLVIDISTPTELLAERGDVDFVPSEKTTAIDQRQAEERRGQTLT